MLLKVLVMRDWRTPREKADDERAERGLKLEAWSIGLALTIMFLIALRAWLQ